MMIHSLPQQYRYGGFLAIQGAPKNARGYLMLKDPQEAYEIVNVGDIIELEGYGRLGVIEVHKRYLSESIDIQITTKYLGK